MAALARAIGEDAMNDINLPSFGGQPGEPVPEVDPEDLKATWEFQQELQAQHPGEQVGMGASLAQSICKPGADIQAVGYRSSMIWMITRIVPEQIAPFLNNGQPTDAVFRAAAKVRLEWMGVGIVRQDPPFDVNEFLRLCAEKT
ncbi:MAG TPA: hypothetical protein VFM77_16125 [Terriglobales bacterium]|nr:hypothetical protein [Terriglobales bacterium]